MRTMKCMIRNFDSSSTLFNMYLEGLGWLRPQGSVSLKNDVLERSDAWIERFCSGDDVSEDLENILLSEVFFRTTQKAAYQGTHHNKTRPPLNILFLFTEKDFVHTSTISHLKSAKKEQCFRVFPIGLGPDTTKTVQELLCINGGRGVVMTNERVSFDLTLKGPVSTIIDDRVESNLKGTRDVLLTIVSDMCEPYVCYVTFSPSISLFLVTNA